MRNKNGSTLIIVICCGLLIALAVASLIFITSNLARANRRLYDRTCATETSESGIASVLSKMCEQGLYNVTSPVIENFATHGQYTVYQKILTNGHVLLSSKGKFRTAEISTAMEVLGDIWSLYDKVLGVDGTIISGGDVCLDSSAINITGTIHANRNILSSQGKPNIDGTLTAVGKITGSINCTGNMSSNANVITVPDYRPFVDWEMLAKTNGLYYASDLTLKGENLMPNNGIVYVRGNVIVNGNSSIKGTIIASGTITINNNFEQTAFNTNWPALLAGQDISLYNRNNLYGVFFAGGNINSVNQKNITGVLIAMGNVEIKNNMNLLPLNHGVQWSPFDTNNAPNQPIVGGWLQ